MAESQANTGHFERSLTALCNEQAFALAQQMTGSPHALALVYSGLPKSRAQTTAVHICARTGRLAFALSVLMQAFAQTGCGTLLTDHLLQV